MSYKHSHSLDILCVPCLEQALSAARSVQREREEKQAEFLRKADSIGELPTGMLALPGESPRQPITEAEAKELLAKGRALQNSLAPRIARMTGEARTVDWNVMTTEEVLAALRSAPKVAGAWVEYQKIWERVGFKPAHPWLVNVYEEGGQWVSKFLLPRAEMAHDTLDEAKAAVDAELIRRGWRLL